MIHQFNFVLYFTCSYLALTVRFCFTAEVQSFHNNAHNLFCKNFLEDRVYRNELSKKQHIDYLAIKLCKTVDGDQLWAAVHHDYTIRTSLGKKI